MSAVGFGQRVVDDDEVAAEAGVVFQERAEGDERTRHEAFRGGGDEAGLLCGVPAWRRCVKRQGNPLRGYDERLWRLFRHYDGW